MKSTVGQDKRYVIGQLYDDVHCARDSLQPRALVVSCGYAATMVGRRVIMNNGQQTPFGT